jgi:hypothetical protein
MRYYSLGDQRAFSRKLDPEGTVAFLENGHSNKPKRKRDVLTVGRSVQECAWFLGDYRHGSPGATGARAQIHSPMSGRAKWCVEEAQRGGRGNQAAARQLPDLDDVQLPGADLFGSQRRRGAAKALCEGANLRRYVRWVLAEMAPRR